MKRSLFTLVIAGVGSRLRRAIQALRECQDTLRAGRARTAGNHSRLRTVASREIGAAIPILPTPTGASARPVVIALAAVVLASVSHSATPQSRPDIVWSRGQGRTIYAASAMANGAKWAELCPTNNGQTIVRILRASDRIQLHAHYIPASTPMPYLFDYSPTGDRFVHSDGSAITMYDADSGTPLWSVADPPYLDGTASPLDEGMQFKFSSDGTRVVYGTNLAVVIRDAATGAAIAEVPRGSFYVSPVTHEMAVARFIPGDGWNVRFHSTLDGSVTGFWARPYATHLVPRGYSGDGQNVIVQATDADGNHDLGVFRRSDRQGISSIPGTSRAQLVRSVGTTIYVATNTPPYGNPRDLFEFDLSTLQKRYVAGLHDLVRGMLPLPNGPVLVYGENNFSSYVDALDPATGQPDWTNHGPTTLYAGFALSPDGQTIAAADGKNIFLYDTLTGEELRRHRYEPEGRQVAGGIKWSPNGTLLLIQSYHPVDQYRQELRNAADLSLVRSLSETWPYHSASFTPDGATLYTTHLDYQTRWIRRWDVATGLPTAVKVGYGGAIGLSPSGEHIAVGMINVGGNGAPGMTLFDSNLAYVTETSGGAGTVGTNISWSTDGTKIAVGAAGGYVRVYGFNGSDLSLLTTYSEAGFGEYYKPFAFDPIDGCYLLRSYSRAHADPFGILLLSPIDSGTSIYYDREVGFGRDGIADVAITPDGQYLVYMVLDGTVVVARNPKAAAPPADNTAPTTTVDLDPAPNAAGWHNTQTSVALRATDNEGGSDVAATYYAVNGGDPLVYTGSPVTFSAEGEYQVVFWSADVAGNLESAQSIAIKIDATEPTLTFGAPSPTANGTGWNNTPVSIPYTAADNLSGVATASPGSPLVITSEGVSKTGTVTVTDRAGNSATFTSPAVDIDLTPPSLSAPDVEATATRANGADVAFAPVASDDLSGVAGGVTCSRESGSAFPLGKTIVTCTATDVAGNTTTQTFAVTVTFAWSDVLQPVNADGTSVFKLGRPIPVRFKLTGASSGITDAIANLSYTRIGDSTGGVNEADQQGNADTGNRFRYDATTGQYVFTMSTKTLVAGRYRLIIDLHDGETRTVEVSVR